MPERLTDAVVDIATQLRRIADAHTPPVAVTPADDDQAAQQPTAGTREFAERERARMERLYTRETVRVDKAEKRANRAELAVEDYRGAVSHALGLGTSAPWDVIHARAAELAKVETALNTAENRLSLAHQARRAKVAQLDDIKRAMLDTGLMIDGDPYSHADLADVIRQTTPDDGLRAEVDEATSTLRRIRSLHVRNANTDCCEHCSERDYPDYAVPYPCPTAEALAGPRPDAR